MAAFGTLVAISESKMTGQSQLFLKIPEHSDQPCKLSEESPWEASEA